MCPPRVGSDACNANVQPSCVAGTCTLQCTPIQCDLTCDNGFVIDTSGCLTCACAPPSENACTTAAGSDDSCVEVPADCCGCARGGKDTAMLSSQVAAFQASLNCPTQPQCPETNACDPTVQPTCSETRCELLSTVSQPANECGEVTPECHANGVDGSLDQGAQLDCPTAKCERRGVLHQHHRRGERSTRWGVRGPPTRRVTAERLAICTLYYPPHDR